MHRGEPRCSALVAANLLMQVLGMMPVPSADYRAAAKNNRRSWRQGGRRRSCSIPREPPQFYGI
ncbi:hypothetical protein EMEDMD4_520078 [Sinorhizobium medicae]|uniref:Uncharacterized protein n=1 Tax=Sinorhizobium medicae TaxID=110321 RepID=A0A508X1Z5_9HYPH|nr:hypothetical protein EMEDMD4_520078 [Sinorhizobium medicae]